jgi:hypothetical protein
MPAPGILVELAENTTIGLFLLGSHADGLPLMWANQSFRTRTGIAPGNLLFQGDERPFFGPLEVALVDVDRAKRILPTLASGVGGEFTLHCRALDGHTYWADVTITPRTDADGNVTHFLGQAVDVTARVNMRFTQYESRMAEALQRAMLPQAADVTALDVWTYYAPNAEHTQVGGDWYDVLNIDADTIGVVVGDVVGHDVEAAAAMGQLRSVVRSYALESFTPGEVLDRVDQIVPGMRMARSASMVFGTLHRTGHGVDGAPDSWELEYTRAGHLPPILVRAGEARQLSEGSGMLVGYGSEPRTTFREALEPGDVLVFFTDGLIERRDRPLLTGIDALMEVSAVITARDAAGIGEEILSRVGAAPEDDVAIVVVRIPDPLADAGEPSLSPRSRRWMLPSEPSSMSRARQAIARTCHAWGMDPPAAAELVVSELVANAVMHGWGNISLRLFATDLGLRVEVEDSNPAPPVATDGHPNRMGGFGMQIVDRLADWGWRPSGTGKLVWAELRSSPSAEALATIR